MLAAYWLLHAGGRTLAEAPPPAPDVEPEPAPTLEQPVALAPEPAPSPPVRKPETARAARRKPGRRPKDRR